LEQIDFLALNPEDSSRQRLDAALSEEGVELRIRVETAYTHTICELALLGVGVGFVNPMAVRDFVERGLVVKPFSIDVPFISILVFQPGKPMTDNAKQFVRALRIQLNRDLAHLPQK
jgi:DNA-binding transcriptional LysR family regulator